jgi:nucleotide-binding universal stress UspA family protein
MTELNPTPVVVAVGTDDIDAALAYAAREAASAGCGIHLVHVVHLLVQGPDGLLVEVSDQEQVGRLALNAAVERLQDMVEPGTTVTTDLQIGRVVPALVDLAQDARMIVLEHRDLSRMQRVVTRSVASGVAAHARVPVVSVPADWNPFTGTEERITVGVDVPDQSGHVLRAALDVAKRRGATLHVLHTWSFPVAYDDALISPQEDRQWADRARAEVEQVLAGLGDAATGVKVDVEARHARPADALIEASRTSTLLVVGRHDSVMPVGSHLGPVARAVLTESACPVLLADPVPTARRRAREAAHAASS